MWDGSWSYWFLNEECTAPPTGRKTVIEKYFWTLNWHPKNEFKIRLTTKDLYQNKLLQNVFSQKWNLEFFQRYRTSRSEEFSKNFWNHIETREVIETLYVNNFDKIAKNWGTNSFEAVGIIRPEVELLSVNIGFWFRFVLHFFQKIVVVVGVGIGIKPTFKIIILIAVMNIENCGHGERPSTPLLITKQHVRLFSFS